MTLFYIQRNGQTGLDENYAMVIRADSPHEARQLAATKHADESPGEWLDDNRTFVEVVTEYGPDEVVLIACNGAG